MKTPLEALFGSKLRIKALRLLLAHPEGRYYVRQLSELLEEDSTNLSRELARLEAGGILVSAIMGTSKILSGKSAKPSGWPPARTANGGAGAIGEVPGVTGYVEGLLPAAPYQEIVSFGSALRDDFRPDSDVDVLVEFEPGHVPGFAIVDMEDELSRLVGRKVDLRTPGDLSRYFRDRVINEARLEYAETGS